MDYLMSIPSPTILLVDDEHAIRKLGELSLSREGYRVLVAHNGHEAIPLFEKHHQEIDLVILDCIMPGLGGAETFEQLIQIKPTVRVLFSSGYSNQPYQLLPNIVGFLPKPYQSQELANAVQDGLNKVIE
jgi:two-component system, cell cycle sensor histidine kinase and response regulator CckA